MPSSLTPADIRYYKAHASDSLQPNMIAANVCGLILPFMAVALRFIARRNSVAVIGADDWLILGALVPLTGYAISSLLNVHYGGGRHIIFVKSAESYVQSYIAILTSYAACVILTKFSILYFYHRIFPSKGLLRVSWAIEFVVVAYNAALVLVSALQCIPLSSLWTRKPATCIETLTPFTILAVVNVVTDVLILALPIKYVWNLRMPTVRKLQVCGIFLLGSVVCVFGIIRCYYVATAAPVDQSYTQVPSGLWSHAEMSVGVVAACLPTFGILFSKMTLIPPAGSSLRRMISNTWSNWTRSNTRSSRKTGDVSLAEWPSQSNYEVYPDTSSSGTRAKVDQGHKLGEVSTVTTARGPHDDDDERPFAKMANPEGIYHQSTFTVAREMHKSASEV